MLIRSGGWGSGDKSDILCHGLPAETIISVGIQERDDKATYYLTLVSTYKIPELGDTYKSR